MNAGILEGMIMIGGVIDTKVEEIVIQIDVVGLKIPDTVSLNLLALD